MDWGSIRDNFNAVYTNLFFCYYLQDLIIILHCFYWLYSQVFFLK